MKHRDEGQEDLVQRIEAERGRPLPPLLRETFFTVSRAHFVPSYYKQERPGIWVAQDARDVVYHNRALITRIDEANRPCSSSSQPSIMAAMLEALDLFPGAQVLEIGTGTGYNGALLAEMVGEHGSVTSVDVDEQLVHLAGERLEAAGYARVHVICVDGFQPIPFEPAIFDRIIVTGGSSFLSSAWIEQLAPKGVVVGNLLGSLATPLFVLVKQEQRIRGKLLATPAFFMSLSGDPFVYGAFNLSRFQAMPVIEEGYTAHFVEALNDLSLKIFLESQSPGISLRPHYLGGDPTDWHAFATCLTYADSLVTFFPAREAGHRIEVRGSFHLWSHLQRLYQQWQAKGTPSVDQYELSVEPSGHHRISLHTESCSTLHINQSQMFASQDQMG